MTTPQDATPRVAVIGAGWWSSSYHLPSLATTEHARLTAVVEPDADRRTRVAERHGVPVFADVDELAASGLADGVVVAVPHEAHHQVASAALDAGLHVFLEKPMALNARDAWDLVDRSRRAQLHLMLGYTHQVTRLARRLRSAIVGGEMGEVVHVAALSATMLEPLLRESTQDLSAFGQVNVPPNPATYARPGVGGQAWSQLTHATGFVCYVTGERPTEVAAVMSSRDLRVDLADAVSVRFESGALATFSSTGSVRRNEPEQQELRFYGTAGYALVDLLAGTLELGRSDGTVEHLALEPDEICPPLEPVRRFADLLASRAANPAPAEPAAHAVEIIEAAHRSDEQRRTVAVAELRERRG